MLSKIIEDLKHLRFWIKVYGLGEANAMGKTSPYPVTAPWYTIWGVDAEGNLTTLTEFDYDEWHQGNIIFLGYKGFHCG